MVEWESSRNLEADAGRLTAAERAFLAALNAYYLCRYPVLTGDFLRRHRRLPNIAFPRGYGDRMQWRKIFDHNPQFGIFADKLATKKFIAERIPGLALSKVLWVGDSADAIPRELLTGNVVVKASHGSAFNFFIRDGQYDWNALRRACRKWLRTYPYGRFDAEWAYRLATPKLFVEERLPGDSRTLIDINIRAGRGRVAVGSLAFNAKTRAHTDVFIGAERRVLGGFAAGGVQIHDLSAYQIPPAYDEALECAKILSRDIDYARFDFLLSEGKLYGGEITLYPSNGYGPIREFVPGGFTLVPGAQTAAVFATWDLRASWFLSTPQAGWRERYRQLLLRRL